jgi:hypothetical protein
MRSLAAVAIGILCGIWAPPAAADAVLLNDGRRLEIAGTGVGCADEYVRYLPAAPFAPFDESHTLPSDAGGTLTAAQDSFVGTAAMGGSGMVADSSGTEHFCALSVFEITFQLDEATPYVFTGTLVSTDSSASGGFRLSREEVTDVVFFHDVYGIDTEGVQEAGTLLPGEYTMRASMRSGVVADASWDFSFTLVPEPSTFLLLGLGLAGLSVRRSRP